MTNKFDIESLKKKQINVFGDCIIVEFVWLMRYKEQFRAWSGPSCQTLLSDKRYTYDDINNFIKKYKCIADETRTNCFSFDGEMKLRKVRLQFRDDPYKKFIETEL